MKEINWEDFYEEEYWEENPQKDNIIIKHISFEEQRDPNKRWNQYKVGDTLVCKVNYPNLKLYKGNVYTIVYVDLYRLVFDNYDHPSCVCEPYKVYRIFYTEDEIDIN